LNETGPPARIGGWAFVFKNMKILARFILIIFISAFGISYAAIDETLARIQNDSLLSSASIGISIFDISGDSAIFRYRGDKLFTPASNLKLFTSAAALEQLGPSFRFNTEFRFKGSIDKKGKLKGALIIVGGGDPLISGRFRSSITEILRFWADSLKSRGIREICGKLIADNSLFAPPVLGPGWSWDDLSYWYACPISALSFNDNCVDLKFLPGKRVGDPAIIEFNPATNYISVQNDAITLSADSSFNLDYYRTPTSNDIAFFGGISIGDSAGRIDYVSVFRPELYTLTIFEGVLKSNGIKLSNEICSLDDMKKTESLNYSPDKLSPLFRWQSDSLPVVLKVIDTNSQNFFAEQTLKMLGAVKNDTGSFQSGIKAVQAFLDSIGISDRDILMYDGSGLSYMNLVKPDAIVKLLAAMSHSSNFDIYYGSLGNPEQDRALSSRLQDNPDRGNVRAKTGYIAGANTFSGYAKGPKSGKLLAFSIMINDYNCNKSYAEAWEDSLVTEILKEY
jgi:D-alanyl-D-alanine carboxypeptidase/D-alanyl-D-alanine-endopeptidase (penicillin-binding protein 4)